jgi:hypothetical protein
MAYTIGKAQEKVLAALGLEAADFGEAEALFERIGIIVKSKRGVPVVSLRKRQGGGFSDEGDGFVYDIAYDDVDLSPLAEWMEA